MSDYPNALLYHGTAAAAATATAGVIVDGAGVAAPTIPMVLLNGTAQTDLAWFFKVISDTPGSSGGMPVFATTAAEYCRYRGVVLHGKRTRSAAFHSDIVQLGTVPVGERVAALVLVTAASGSSPTLNVTLSSSPNSDFSSPTTRGTFTQISAAGLQYFEVDGAAWTDLYWRIDATIGGSGASFDVLLALGVSGRTMTAAAVFVPVAPSTPVTIAPSSGDTGVDLFTLSWFAAGATSYDVYFGTTPAPTLVSSGQAGASYAAGALSASTTYYWKIVATNDVGSTAGPVWSFTATAAPAAPNTPTPADAATGINRDSPFHWVSARADTFDVYFDTSNPPTTLVASGISSASYAPGVMSASTTYHMRIVASNAVGSTTGPVWSFSTGTTFGEDSVNVLSTTTATGTHDDFNVGALASLNVLRCNNAALLTIDGITDNGATPTDGAMLWIYSVGAGQVDIANQAAGSTAADRIITGVTGKISLAPGVGRALLEYDGTSGRWRVLEHEQGAWINVPYNAGDFVTFGGGGTWTVDSGDVATFRYWLKGRTLSIALYITASTVGSTPARLVVTIPGGLLRLASPFQQGPAGRTFHNAAFYDCIFDTETGSTSTVGLAASDLGSGWQPSTNDTYLYTTFTFEVQ